MDEYSSKISIVLKSITDFFNSKYDPPESKEFTGEGVFVTLHLNGNLRGCIGCLEGNKPVDILIYKYARAAAFEDPRFHPLTETEFEEIEPEITILSPMKKIDNVDDIEIGRDGLLLRKGFRSGVFLPQVPVEQEWDLDQYLEHICYKAGLPAGSWKDTDSELYTFTGRIIK